MDRDYQTLSNNTVRYTAAHQCLTNADLLPTDMRYCKLTADIPDLGSGFRMKVNSSSSNRAVNGTARRAMVGFKDLY